MRRFVLTAAALLLVQVPALFAQKVDLRNYAVGGYNANPNEMRVAERRASRYWRKNGSRIGDKARYLAIEAASVIPGDVIQPLWQNIFAANCLGSWKDALCRDLRSAHFQFCDQARFSGDGDPLSRDFGEVRRLHRSLYPDRIFLVTWCIVS